MTARLSATAATASAPSRTPASHRATRTTSSASTGPAPTTTGAALMPVMAHPRPGFGAEPHTGQCPVYGTVRDTGHDLGCASWEFSTSPSRGAGGPAGPDGAAGSGPGPGPGPGRRPRP